jgi:hypothetical protein
VALVFLVVALALAAFYAFYPVRWILPGHPRSSSSTRAAP